MVFLTLLRIFNPIYVGNNFSFQRRFWSFSQPLDAKSQFVWIPPSGPPPKKLISLDLLDYRGLHCCLCQVYQNVSLSYRKLPPAPSGCTALENRNHVYFPHWHRVPAASWPWWGRAGGWVHGLIGGSARAALGWVLTLPPTHPIPPPPPPPNLPIGNTLLGIGLINGIVFRSTPGCAEPPWRCWQRSVTSWAACPRPPWPTRPWAKGSTRGRKGRAVLKHLEDQEVISKQQHPRHQARPFQPRHSRLRHPLLLTVSCLLCINCFLCTLITLPK